MGPKESDSLLLGDQLGPHPAQLLADHLLGLDLALEARLQGEQLHLFQLLGPPVAPVLLLGGTGGCHNPTGRLPTGRSHEGTSHN